MCGVDGDGRELEVEVKELTSCVAFEHVLNSIWCVLELVSLTRRSCFLSPRLWRGDKKDMSIVAAHVKWELRVELMAEIDAAEEMGLPAVASQAILLLHSLRDLRFQSLRLKFPFDTLTVSTFLAYASTKLTSLEYMYSILA